MDVDLVDETAQQTRFNGAIPLERPRTELTQANRDGAQLQRRKEAEKAYGRGRKIQGMPSDSTVPFFSPRLRLQALEAASFDLVEANVF